MKIYATEEYLPIYEALASNVRLNIIQLLSKQKMNIKEIAKELNLSSAILTMHIRKLEKASIVTSERKYINGAVQKICSLAVDSIEIEFPTSVKERHFHEFSLPVGHYTDFSVTATCGLATKDKLIGYFDDPRYFLDPERVNAGVLWFTEGYVEYKVPNYLLSGQIPQELEISMELGSEAPNTNNDWPSDISFFINDIKIGQWTSPGDFGNQRGKYAPKWWSENINQYGLLKVIKINQLGCFIDGTKASDITIDQVDISKKQWTFKVAVLKDAKHVGGATIYGSGFGNYDQDILFKLYYK